MNRFREKIQRFMAGRYGADQLGRFTMYTVLAFMLLNILIRRHVLSIVLEGLILAGLMLLYFRMFSKNKGRRFQENQIYLSVRSQVMGYWKKIKDYVIQSCKYRIFKCPGCGQKIRIPRGHGRVSIHCPKCGNDFIEKS